MAVRDPIKEIMEDYEEELAQLKEDRERVISLFKDALREKKVKELKTQLKTHEVTRLA